MSKKNGKAANLNGAMMPNGDEAPKGGEGEKGAEKSISPSPKYLTPDVGVRGGEPFQKEKHIRGDARSVASLISLGCITVPQAEQLIRQGFQLLTEAAVAKNSRKYTAMMRLVLETARLAQAERHKLMDKEMPDQVEVTMQQGATIQAALAEIKGDDRFERLARQDAESSYASIVGQHGGEGSVAPSPPSNDGGQGRNGSHPPTNGSAHSGN
jgi:hypothetical protein